MKGGAFSGSGLEQLGSYYHTVSCTLAKLQSLPQPCSRLKEGIMWDLTFVQLFLHPCCASSLQGVVSKQEGHILV